MFYRGQLDNQTQSPFDFILWGYVRNIVFRSQIRETGELKSRITAAFHTVDSPMLRRTWYLI